MLNLGKPFCCKSLGGTAQILSLLSTLPPPPQTKHEAVGLALGAVHKNEGPQIINIDLNCVQVAPFAIKLGQNDAPDPRIVLG